MKAMDWHKHYHEDYRKGTRCLTLEQRGAYKDCLDYMYANEEPIPLDPRIMAHYLMVSKAKWLKILDVLLEHGKLTKTRAGYVNPRVEAELADRNEVRKNKSSGASKRHQKAREISPLNVHSASFQSPLNAHSVTEISEKADLPNEINGGVVQMEYSAPLYIELELEKERKIPPTPKTGDVKIEVEKPNEPNWSMEALKAFQAWNETALRCGLPSASRLTPDRSRKIIARLKDFGPDGWRKALANIEKSKFLTGGTDQGFRADLDFVCQAKSFGKLHDGGYGNGRHSETDKASEFTSALDAWCGRFAAGKGWTANPEAGPEPGKPGCLVPLEILAKHGLAPVART